MEQYCVKGMSCAACSARVEKAVRAVPGVTDCAVSLLTNSMGVDGDARPEDIIDAVIKAGYGASLKGAGAEENSDDETGKLLKRLLISLAILLPLMYVSMGHNMFGFPLPKIIAEPVVNAVVQAVLSLVVIIINRKFYTSGFRGAIHRSPNMDTLVAMGSGVSYLYSVVYSVVMISSGMTEHMVHGLYFESAAMILVLITVGKTLEARSKGKTTDALKSLMNLKPMVATKITVDENGNEVSKIVGVSQIKVDDIFAVKPGESIPVDGIVISGTSAVNEAALTGESIPVDKEEGDEVSAATINRTGYIKCRATRVGNDTTLSRIIKMVSDAAATKAPIAKLADKVSGIFVPTVIVIAFITFIIWFAVKGFAEPGYALARAISVLVISCPCALGLATPVAIMVGNGVGAKNGILFKNATSLENLGRTQIVALDKTGTVTTGEPVLTDTVPADGVSEEELLRMAYMLESKSEHPLAKAVVNYFEAKEASLKDDEVEDFEILPGSGLRGKYKGKELMGGNAAYLKKGMAWENFMSSDVSKKAEALSKEGKTPLLFAYDGRFLGFIAVADEIKEDSKKAVEELKTMGIRVVMLTGDSENTAKAIAAQAGIDEVIAGVTPEFKAVRVNELKEQGKTAMVGDGINDAPALTTADSGIAIGAGTDVAIDAADVVLVKSRLTDLAAAIRLSKITLTNIKENLFWAFIYNIIGIPLAAGAWIPVFGWELNPMFGAAAMSLSSFCVCMNALRINLKSIYKN
ncbi:MAG: copper-translocating P-type ATPase [Lachnospiraceae bacterium]|nr:copper-translocating P-type ATPase [Lachnospiraceae bacterium]